MCHFLTDLNYFASIEQNTLVGRHAEGSLELNIPSEANVTAVLRSVMNTGTAQRPLQTFILYGIKFCSLYPIGASMSKTKYQQSGVEGFDSRGETGCADRRRSTGQARRTGARTNWWEFHQIARRKRVQNRKLSHWRCRDGCPDWCRHAAGRLPV